MNKPVNISYPANISSSDRSNEAAEDEILFASQAKSKAASGQAPTPRPASGVQPPPAPPPSLPEAGKHPEAVLAESEFNAAWEQALEERYGGGSLNQNLARYRQQLAGADNPKSFGVSEYKAVYGIFRRIVSKDPKLSGYNWEGAQLHHIGAKAQEPVPEPERAVDPNNLLFTRGNARSPGTSHNTAQYGPDEVRRQQWEASRRATRQAGDPSTPSARPSGSKVTGGEPTAVEPTPAEPVAEGGGAGLKGGALSVAPAVATEVGKHFVQKQLDEAADQRRHYNGRPTQEQIETQRAAGFEFTGRLDKDGRPEWEFKPSLKLRLQRAYHFLFNPFSPLQYHNPDGTYGDWA